MAHWDALAYAATAITPEDLGRVCENGIQASIFEREFTESLSHGVRDVRKLS
jgi:hypothetical protein